MDTRIFVCTHKLFPEPGLTGYIPLNVGSALRPDLGYERDDGGDNISAKNASFCEPTGLYYVWKNVKCDVVGICHYRRFFAEGEYYLSAAKAQEYLKDYDVILPATGFPQGENLRAHYKSLHYIKDLEKTREVLLRLYPEYGPAFDHVMSCTLFSVGNMIITRKEIFDAYCEWLFDILFVVEKETDISSYDTFQARLYGYLSERLIRVWLIMQDLRIAEVDFYGTDLREVEAERKRLQLMRDYTDSVIADVITLYKKGQMADLIEDWPAKSFDGKIPAFFWGKGKAFADEAKTLLPEGTEFVYLDPENVKEYACLPEHYRNLPAEEQKEMLRAMILYRYGGFWIDEEAKLPTFLPEKVTELSFYSIRLQTIKFHEEITEGRWDPRFMYMKPHTFLGGFLMNALCYFRFQSANELFFPMTDCILDSAVRAFEEAAQQMEEVPFAEGYSVHGRSRDVGLLFAAAEKGV